MSLEYLIVSQLDQIDAFERKLTIQSVHYWWAGNAVACHEKLRFRIASPFFLAISFNFKFNGGVCFHEEEIAIAKGLTWLHFYFQRGGQLVEKKATEPIRRMSFDWNVGNLENTSLESDACGN